MSAGRRNVPETDQCGGSLKRTDCGMLEIKGSMSHSVREEDLLSFLKCYRVPLLAQGEIFFLVHAGSSLRVHVDCNHGGSVFLAVLFQITKNELQFS